MDGSFLFVCIKKKVSVFVKLDVSDLNERIR